MMNDVTRQQTVMISGAGGFLGQELIRQLLDRTYFQVIALTTRKESVQEKYARFGRVLVADPQDWKKGRLPFHEVGILVHTAFPRSESGAELAEGLQFTNELFHDAAYYKVPAIVNISSRSVYGQIHQPPWTEQTPVAPGSMYALAKYAAEQMLSCLQYSCGYPLRTTSLRLAGLTGAGFDARLTTRFVDQALLGETIRIIGGRQQFSYLDVRDAAAGIIALLSVDPSEWKNVYNLGGNTCHTIAEIAQIVAEVAGEYTSVPVTIEVEEKEIVMLDGMDSDLFFRDVNWVPEHDMRSIIRSLFEYRQGRPSR